MSKGYVYILTNESMPGLVKIGRTTRSVEGRAGELYQTGVPTPFVVYDSVCTPDCHWLENVIHGELNAARVSGAREFFRVEPEKASRALYDASFIIVEAWLSEFVPDHAIIQDDFSLCPGMLGMMAEAYDLHPVEVVTVINALNVPDLEAPAHRYKEHVKERDIGGKQ